MIRIPATSTADLKEDVAATIVRGSDEQVVTELGEPLEVGPSGVVFVFSEKALKEVAQTRASVVVIQSSFAKKIETRMPETVRLCIECEDAYLGLAWFSKRIRDMDPIFDWQLGTPIGGAIHHSASISESAMLGPGVIVGERAVIGAGSVVLGNAVIGPEARIGSNCMIYPGVVIYPRTCVGDRARIHSNAVLGCDGFGYARGPHGLVKIYHLGKVVIGNDVEIGAGTMIDRGTVKDTIIEDGVKIDNLVQIGHNSHVKAHAILCGQVGLSGNVTVGRGAILAGKAGVVDKIEIGDGAVVGAAAALTRNVKPKEHVLGYPARPRGEFWKLIVLFGKLPDLYRRVKKLEANEAAKATKEKVVKASDRSATVGSR